LGFSSDGPSLRAALRAMQPAQATAMRRTILSVLVQRAGKVVISRRFSRSLGLRRRKLRAEVELSIAAGAPFRLGAPDLLVPAGTYLGLVLTPDQLTTLAFTLRERAETGTTKAEIIDATVILAEVLRQLPPAVVARFPMMGRAAPRALARPQPGDGAETLSTVEIVNRAMQLNRKLSILYTDQSEARSERIVWPVTTTFHGTTLAAWCELRQGFRHFRLGKIGAAQVLPTQIPVIHEDLIHQWRLDTGAPSPDLEKGQTR
jgi:predicted DNA-binding transcriptional regulator YafY